MASKKYMACHPASGVWHFRLSVPKALRDQLGLSWIKRSLRTRDEAQAAAWAQELKAECKARFDSLLALRVIPNQRPSLGEWGTPSSSKHQQDVAITQPQEKSVIDMIEKTNDVSRWEVETPEGWKIKVDGGQNSHEKGMQALQAVLAMHTRQKPLMPFESPEKRWPGHKLTLQKAIQNYEELETKEYSSDTRDQRSRAMVNFAQYMGMNRAVSDITRAQASEWSDGLIRAGKTKVSVSGYVSHVAQLFEGLTRKGIIASNPVKGLVVLKKREKAARRAAGHGWEAFEVDTLRALFNPENFKKIKKEHVRWGALLGLYTGARVGEIAQLYLRDFVVNEGIACVKICAESDGQRLKTGDRGSRLVPLHPDLLKLGLMDRVERLREAGEQRLFPAMRIDGASGRGNAITKGFSYYLLGMKVEPRRKHGIIGVHSLRKTVIQMLQGSALLTSERRRALVGHEVGDPPADVHAENYMRPWTAVELSGFFPGLPWADWLDIQGLRPLLRHVTLSSPAHERRVPLHQRPGYKKKSQSD